MGMPSVIISQNRVTSQESNVEMSADYFLMGVRWQHFKDVPQPSLPYCQELVFF
jgi:hypothetical protein